MNDVIKSYSHLRHEVVEYIWLTANVEGVKFTSLFFVFLSPMSLSAHWRRESEGLFLKHLSHSCLLTYVTMWLKNHQSQLDVMVVENLGKFIRLSRRVVCDDFFFYI